MTRNLSTARRAVSKTGRRAALALAAATLATGLAACGGSDGNDDNGNNGGKTPVQPVVTNTPPAYASATSAGFIAYLKILVPTQPDTTEPLDVAAFVAPVDDTGVPDPAI